MSSCVDFARDIVRTTLTVGQTAFVRVAIDGVAPVDIEDEDEREAAFDIFGSWSECPAIARRKVTAACGRDSGKTHIGALVALYKMMTVDLTKCGPGDVPRAIVVAPDVDTAKLTLERIVAMVEGTEENPCELSALLVGPVTSEGFTLRRLDGRLVRFEPRAASRGGKSIRGRSLVVVILDEAALFYGEGYQVNDREIVNAAVPRLLPGALVLLLSTPWAAEGAFYKLHDANHGQPVTAIAARAHTLVMRDNDPEIAEQVALEEAEDPDNCARERGAEFLPSGASQFFDGAAIAAAMAHEWNVDASIAAKGAGADIGLTRDSSALAIVLREGERYQVVETEELRPEKGSPLKLSRVVSAFAATMGRHGVRTMHADAHVREPAREFADLHKVTIEPAPEGAAAKFDSYVLVRKLLGEGTLRLPASNRLAAQLRAVRSQPMPGGGWKVSAPRSKALGHCDVMSALVVGVWAAEQGRSSNTPIGTVVSCIGHTGSRYEGAGDHWF